MKRLSDEDLHALIENFSTYSPDESCEMIMEEDRLNFANALIDDIEELNEL